MQLGFVSAILPELNLGQVLDFAAREKFACVEVMCWPVGKAERRFAGVTHVDVEGFTRGKADEVHTLCAQSGVALSALGYYPNALDPDPKVSRFAVSHLKKVIKAAQILGLKTVNSFIGRDQALSVDDNWPRFLKVWRPLIAFAEDHDVRVAIENCPMSFTKDEWPGGKNLMTTPAIWRRAFNDIPSAHFGLNYDPSHFVLQRMDPASPLREFQDKLFHLHAKDVKIRHDRLNEVGVFAHPLLWHQPRIPGFGDMDWPRFLAALMETTYRGPVCIEVEDDTFGKTLDGRKSALKVARNVLSPFFEF
ncbi:MAG TPA: sugar phosphate isomerase/epimerase family protein [Tepidisphaeraceae bacterium]|jgi:sugar phosphate isomerase/epimerase|nr:sugar phosphate isomerase/epimerase family protein [Tepidisphaeraceae bacterium]